MEKSYPNILIPRYPGAREYPYSIAENCSAAVFIDEKENVKIADHLNQLAGRKFILKGMLNQVTAKNSIAWIIRSYLGQKHILGLHIIGVTFICVPVYQGNIHDVTVIRVTFKYE